MTTLTQEPQFSADSLRLLSDFQQSFRERVYNLIEDHVRTTGDDKVSRAVLERCLKQAIREYVEHVTQKPMFPNG